MNFFIYVSCSGHPVSYWSCALCSMVNIIKSNAHEYKIYTIYIYNQFTVANLLTVELIWLTYLLVVCLLIGVNDKFDGTVSYEHSTLLPNC